MARLRSSAALSETLLALATPGVLESHLDKTTRHTSPWSHVKHPPEHRRRATWNNRPLRERVKHPPRSRMHHPPVGPPHVKPACGFPRETSTMGDPQKTSIHFKEHHLGVPACNIHPPRHKIKSPAQAHGVCQLGCWVRVLGNANHVVRLQGN